MAERNTPCAQCYQRHPAAGLFSEHGTGRKVCLRCLRREPEPAREAARHELARAVEPAQAQGSLFN